MKPRLPFAGYTGDRYVASLCMIENIHGDRVPVQYYTFIIFLE